MTLRGSEPPRPPQARVGETLAGKWRVDRLIDVGGMAAVYEVTHRNGRRAAIKVLHPHVAYNPEVRNRFLREGYVANRIGHPGAVAILDDDVAEDGSPFLVMELLDGESLSAQLAHAGGTLPTADAVAITAQILEVLEAAHANGVVHRDIKPGNIIVTRNGHAKLLDFGLARIRDGGTSVIPTAVGMVMGTAGYMAPEQARGQPDQVDARSDIFAAGAVLFRMLTGRKVHERETLFDTAIAAMKEPAPSLGTVLPEASPVLVAAVDRALAFDKADRWQNARAMIESLREAYAEVTGPPVHPPAPDRRGRADGPGALADSAADAEPTSLVASVAFGDDRDAAVSRERDRVSEVAESLSMVSISTDDPDERKAK